ncbi:MAG: glycoside hydrolase family 5 protein [Oscillospiraceae bacterium]|nr:glycoside hydrolase family 5 protein [Oscillospiraceae bacterium]
MLVKKTVSIVLALVMLLSILPVQAYAEEAGIMSTSRSIDYAENMGIGWNLGNTLDGRGGDDLAGRETSWGNPVTTREFIQSIADRGFGHIRIPFTIDDRYADNGADTPVGELRYVIHEDWLNRYTEVAEWSLEAGLTVMINIHHDSWIWLGRGENSWDGDINSWQYRRFTDHWKQLAAAFAHMPDTVMFETINEPEFHADAQNRLNLINRAAFDIIRATPGNESRIIVIPTVKTNHESVNSSAARDFIRSLNDENIIATVHYYCDWVFGANLGITMFDEVGSGRTAREAVDSFYEIIDRYFLSEGIGVTVGEWGLLAYDGGTDILQTGEELKYYEYVQHLANENRGVSLSFWDNGSGINRRDTPDFGWHQPRVGAVLENFSERSSYSTGLDTLYFTEHPAEDIEIPLMLNGNEFIGIAGLEAGVDYTFNELMSTVIISADFIKNALQAAAVTPLIMQFSAGTDWEQYIVSLGTPEYGLAAGTRSAGISIPVNLNGARIRNIAAEQNGSQVGGNQLWWRYLHNGEAFRVSYGETSYLTLLGNFFSDSVKEGQVTLNINYFDGSSEALIIDVLGEAGGSAVTTIPAPELPPMPLNITSLTYNFLIENIADEESLHFEMIGDVWPANVSIIELSGDGEYTVTAEFPSGIAGIIHLGFIRTVSESDITLTVNNIIVNNDITLAFDHDFVIQAGSGRYNTMPHRWTMGDEMLIGDELLYDGRRILLAADGEYWIEFSAGVDPGETGIFVLNQRIENSGDEAVIDEQPIESDDGDIIETASESGTEPNSNTGIIIAIAAGVLILAATAAAVLLRKRKK